MRKMLTYALITAGLVLPMHTRAAEKVHFIYSLSIYATDQGEALNRPEGVACNREGNLLYVADSGNGRILSFAIVDRQISGGAVLDVPQVKFPTRIQINSKGDLFVLDGKARKIFRLDPTGKFKGVVDAKGTPAGEKVIPLSFKIDSSDNIHLLDIFSGKVVVLDAEGTYLREIGFQDKQGFFLDLAVDHNGTIYLVDGVNSSLYAAEKEDTLFHPFGKDLSEYMNFPSYITAFRGSIFLVDRNGGGIVILGQDGAYRGRQLSLGWQEGRLYYPAQICFTGEGAIIADRENDRVQFFTISRK